MATADALIEMTTQCRSAATDDGIEHLAMRPRKMRLLLFPETVAPSTDDVGHLEGGSAHRALRVVARLEFIQHHLPKIGHGNLNVTRGLHSPQRPEKATAAASAAPTASLCAGHVQ